MITLFTYAPDRLNLNGDQGNILILQRHLEWAALKYKTVEVNGSAVLLKAAKAATSGERAFLLVGHGSMAAMRSLAEDRDELLECIDAFRKANAPALVIGSSFEALKTHTQRPERLSHFQESAVVSTTFGSVTNQGPLKVFGYLNSRADLPAIQSDGSILYTLLHGPILAKSPELLSAVLKYFGVHNESGERFERLGAVRQLAIDTAKSLD